MHKTITYDMTTHKLVPIEPTQEMVKAIYSINYNHVPSEEAMAEEHYSAMLSAAPEPEAAPVDGSFNAALAEFPWADGNGGWLKKCEKYILGYGPQIRKALHLAANGYLSKQNRADNTAEWKHERNLRQELERQIDMLYSKLGVYKRAKDAALDGIDQIIEMAKAAWCDANNNPGDVFAKIDQLAVNTFNDLKNVSYPDINAKQPQVTDQETQVALKNCDAIQKVYPDLEPVLREIRAALPRPSKRESKLVEALRDLMSFIKISGQSLPAWAEMEFAQQALAEYEATQ